MMPTKPPDSTTTGPQPARGAKARRRWPAARFLAAGTLAILALVALVLGVFYSWSGTLMHHAPGRSSGSADPPATLRSVVFYCMDGSLGVAAFQVDTTRMGAAGWGSFAPGFKGQTWHARNVAGQSYQVANFYAGPVRWAWNGFVLRSQAGQTQRELQAAVPTWFALLAGGLLAWRAGVAWRRARRSPHACARCGYDLRGTPGGACPECGSAREGGGAGGSAPEPLPTPDGARAAPPT